MVESSVVCCENAYFSLITAIIEMFRHCELQTLVSVCVCVCVCIIRASDCMHHPVCPQSGDNNILNACECGHFLSAVVYCVLGDGSCVCMSTAALTGVAQDDQKLCTELTGSDCDPVYRAVSDGRSLFTCCRDSVIRRYALNSLLEL